MNQHNSLETVINEHYDLIPLCLNKLKIYRDREDYAQTGVLGLLHAHDIYEEEKDPNKNFRAFAYYYIINAMKNQLTKFSRYGVEQPVGDHTYHFDSHYVEPHAELEFRMLLEQFTNRLSPLQKMIILLKTNDQTKK